MNKIIASIIIIILVSCQNEQKDTNSDLKMETFKIIIESDPNSYGTKNRYTLTNNSFEHRYLKDELTPNDTILESYENIEPNNNLKKISEYNLDDLHHSGIINENSMNFTLIKDGMSKTVRIDEHPNDFICEVITYMNDLMVEKYQIDFGCKK